MIQHGCMLQVMQNMMLVIRKTMVQTIATTIKPEANFPRACIEEDIDTDVMWLEIKLGCGDSYEYFSSFKNIFESVWSFDISGNDFIFGA